MSNYQHQLETARQIAREAGEILMSYFGRAAISEKSSQNLVTEADLASEKAITEAISREFPDHLFLREEGESTALGHEDHVWVIDPLDATNNYAHGIPHFSVSIAYTVKGTPVVGVVLDPVRQEEFYAMQEGGAFLNGQRISTSNRKTLQESIIGTGFFYDRGILMERTLEGIRALFKKNIRGIRRSGGAALDLSWVACGRFDGFFEYQLESWDYAAGALLVTEAGGKCTDRSGNPLRIDSRHIIASNPGIHDALVDTVQW